MKTIPLIIAVLCLSGCSEDAAPAASVPQPPATYDCREVIIHGRKYLIQKQEIGYMRGSEWRVVAGPMP